MLEHLPAKLERMEEIETLPPRPMDAKLLALADTHSPIEISDRLGGVVSPKAVAQRITELLQSRDWLTATQQDQLITIRMANILTKLEGKFEDVGNLTLQLKVLKELGTRLDKRNAATVTDLNSLYANQGRIMAHAFDLALSYMAGALRDEIDPERWDELAKEGLEHAQVELSRHEAIAQ